eukprot:gene12651-13950_t
MLLARSFCVILLYLIFDNIDFIISIGRRKKTDNNNHHFHLLKNFVSQKSKVSQLGFVSSNAWTSKSIFRKANGKKKLNKDLQWQPNDNINKNKKMHNREKSVKRNKEEIRKKDKIGDLNKIILASSTHDKGVHDMKKNEISPLNTRGPNSNMITDLKVPNMGKALQWTQDDNNSSNSATNIAAANATQREQNATTNGHSNNDDGPTDTKIKNLLDALEDDSSVAKNSTSFANNTSALKSVYKDVNAQKKQIIGPGYYEPECDDEKKCPDNHYCDHYVCMDCHRSKHACTHRKQCCDNMECIYGRCEDKPKGSPGAFCHKDKDCSGEACCVLEPTVDEEESICKPKLAEYHQCSPILYRKLWIGDNKPDCGPCKGGLKCLQKGNDGSHQVCMKE